MPGESAGVSSRNESCMYRRSASDCDTKCVTPPSTRVDTYAHVHSLGRRSGGGVFRHKTDTKHRLNTGVSGESRANCTGVRTFKWGVGPRVHGWPGR